MLNDIYHALDPVALQLGPFAIRWYGLGYIVGILLGMFVLVRVARRWNIRVTTDNVLTLIIAAALGIILGGRLGYVLFYGAGYYLEHPMEILAFNNGGMSFHGGVIGMVIAMAVTARLTRIPLLTLGDLVVIAAPPGIFLVRCANFINGELWGATTDLPWGVVFDGAGSLPRHPTQLYEAVLEGLVMFAVLYAMSRKSPPRPRGTFVGTFMLLYGIFRIAVEFVRQPDAQIGYLFGDWLTMGMVLSLPLVLIGISILVFAHVRGLPQSGAPDTMEVTPQARDVGPKTPEASEDEGGQPTQEDTGSGRNDGRYS